MEAGIDGRLSPLRHEVGPGGGDLRSGDAAAVVVQKVEEGAVHGAQPYEVRRGEHALVPREGVEGEDVEVQPGVVGLRRPLDVLAGEQRFHVAPPLCETFEVDGHVEGMALPPFLPGVEERRPHRDPRRTAGIRRPEGGRHGVQQGVCLPLPVAAVEQEGHGELADVPRLDFQDVPGEGRAELGPEDGFRPASREGRPGRRDRAEDGGRGIRHAVGVQKHVGRDDALLCNALSRVLRMDEQAVHGRELQGLPRHHPEPRVHGFLEERLRPRHDGGDGGDGLGVVREQGFHGELAPVCVRRGEGPGGLREQGDHDDG